MHGSTVFVDGTWGRPIGRASQKQKHKYNRFQIHSLQCVATPTSSMLPPIHPPLGRMQIPEAKGLFLPIPSIESVNEITRHSTKRRRLSPPSRNTSTTVMVAAVAAAAVLVTIQFGAQVAQGQGLTYFALQSHAFLVEGTSPAVAEGGLSRVPTDPSTPSTASSTAVARAATPSPLVDGEVQILGFRQTDPLTESYPIAFHMAVDLDVTAQAYHPTLLQNVRFILEDYLFQNIEALESVAESDGSRARILSVSLDICRVIRRQLMFRRRRATMVEPITISVNGSVQCYLSAQLPTTTAFMLTAIGEEISKLMQKDDLRRTLRESGGFETGVTRARRAIQEDVGNETNGQGDAPNENTDVKGDDALTRPSTLSIVLGFLLTGLAAMGLVAYAFIFYTKRRKRMRRKQQMKETIQYRLPNSNTSPPQQPQPATPDLVPPAAKNDESSDDSSYKGLESGSEGETADAFARELQLAASLDKQAWEDFQRKKTALEDDLPIAGPETGSVYSHFTTNPKPTKESPSEPTGLVRSFPYGDEQEVIEEGIEWSASQANVWDEGSGKSEEKKDETTPERQKSGAVNASPESRVEEMDGSGQPNSNSRTQDIADNMTSSDIVLEVERLSRFVKRYEKRKERRLKREQERMNRSSSSTTRDFEGTNGAASPVHESQTPAEAKSSYPTGRNSIHDIERQEDDENKFQPNDAYYPTYMYGEVMSMSDNDEVSDGSDTQEVSLRSQQRLGITPFSVQAPDGMMSPAIQHRSEVGIPNTAHNVRRSRASSDGDHYAKGGGLSRLRGHSAMLDNGRLGLSDLRHNNAIIDSSKSDVNVGYFGGQSDEETPARSNASRQTMESTPGPSPNPKFNKLRSLFEEKKNEAIFPPGQHWQYGGGK